MLNVLTAIGDSSQIKETLGANEREKEENRYKIVINQRPPLSRLFLEENSIAEQIHILPHSLLE